MSETTQAFCYHCGAVRSVGAHCLMDRELRCAACKTTTTHAVLGCGIIEDWREDRNSKGSTKLRQQLDQLKATETVFDKFGIRLNRRPMKKNCARLLAERGPGWTCCLSRSPMTCLCRIS
jgi:hypothetical protein